MTKGTEKLVRKVASPVEAWIETPVHRGAGRRLTVASPVEAWIETAGSRAV